MNTASKRKPLLLPEKIHPKSLIVEFIRNPEMMEEILEHLLKTKNGQVLISWGLICKYAFDQSGLHYLAEKIPGLIHILLNYLSQYKHCQKAVARALAQKNVFGWAGLEMLANVEYTSDAMYELLVCLSQTDEGRQEFNQILTQVARDGRLGLQIILEFDLEHLLLILLFLFPSEACKNALAEALLHQGRDGQTGLQMIIASRPPDEIEKFLKVLVSEFEGAKKALTEALILKGRGDKTGLSLLKNSVPNGVVDLLYHLLYQNEAGKKTLMTVLTHKHGALTGFEIIAKLSPPQMLKFYFRLFDIEGQNEESWTTLRKAFLDAMQTIAKNERKTLMALLLKEAQSQWELNRQGVIEAIMNFFPCLLNAISNAWDKKVERLSRLVRENVVADDLKLLITAKTFMMGHNWLTSKMHEESIFESEQVISAVRNGHSVAEAVAFWCEGSSDYKNTKSRLVLATQFNLPGIEPCYTQERESPDAPAAPGE